MNMKSERPGERRDNPVVRVRIDEFKPHRRNTLLGFASITILDLGMSIKGLSLHEKDGARWCGMPAKEFTSDNGRHWVPFIEFNSKGSRSAFYDAVLAAFDEHTNAGGGE